MPTEKRYPHQVGVGSKIRTRSGRHDTIERISVVFHTASQLDEVYRSDEEVTVLEPQEVQPPGEDPGGE